MLVKLKSHRVLSDRPCSALVLVSYTSVMIALLLLNLDVAISFGFSPGKNPFTPVFRER